ncbi:MAG: cryptochrome/photolyase family protein [Saprospiraceae bacterium]|nr:cryptochrome/photolyase family protein [Saprospiraceae bacterium]
MQTINILFPHQLFQAHAIHENGQPIYLVEEDLFFKEFNFHKAKIAYHRASMKCYQNYLENKGIEVVYIDSQKEGSDIRNLLKQVQKEGTRKINYINPTDNWLEQRLVKIADRLGLERTEYENPLFINTRQDLAHFFKPKKKKFFQTTFYKQERKKHQILIDKEGKPDGGKWTFDTENRKPYPKSKVPPTVVFPTADKHWKEALVYTQKYFGSNLGELPQTCRYPYSFEQTEVWLQQFLEQRFYAFGHYEDAIHKDADILHHSILTPMMNVGLVEPMTVVKRALKYAKEEDIPINSVEGFVRQIIGWREFIRGMYEVKGSASRNENFWNFDRKIPQSFYDGTTGILPIDKTIKSVLKTGYCHHIERLMVLGNFMLLCEFSPKEVYRWFMELFIDAYDWVMVPNVYGMSQFADGGFFATKPYISGSNYIMKMSNYTKGNWQQAWDGLFWRFMHKHREFFLKNPRLAMLIKAFDKMTKEKQDAHLQNAAIFLNKLG